ncbi:transglycosylase domain-containing protein [Geodermatophilus sabuli]|uniref:Membrane carboxypeptidase (Penicillin-binding protein) n=1 Tax=Geodermatophilus sabuli TaxID=1564158 RepID=A0A285E9B9_9ACTN|nr:transglycosylase domain-containing protein [Geodermatophilus sabuli]MBB3085119.1 membrane peptidoglycan carboxypeptidase [Geodermatophilus sabuli]SNX95473.1 Membrane carboxypeptidase (penicillin-binding protein) [Geodermatophilus sabuli]
MARSHTTRADGEPPLRRLRAAGLLLLALPLAGALVAALLSPWVVGPGVAASSSASLLAPLPVELTDATPAGNTVVLAADGSLITHFYRHNRTPVAADRIADVMEQALVDIEDARFHQHNGLDVEGTLRALVRNLTAGSVEEGGSTITQQLVKQTLLETASTPEEQQAAIEQSLARKLREARLALALEETYSKQEILTRYLNLVYFGEGAYGIQAAAQTYFSVDAADLTLPQAALLAGLVQTPAADNPLVDPERARERRDQVLTRMHDLGHITDQELAEASAAPVETAPARAPRNGCVDAVIGGFFCDFLQRHLTDVLGISQERLEDGGLTIRTTLRPDVQTSGDAAVLASLPMGDPLAAIFTAVEPGTGHVLAMSVNRRFGYDADDPAQESVNLNVAASQGAGSTYKVFVAAAALERGFPPWHTITTSDPYVSQVYRDGAGPYVVENVGDFPPTLTMTEALIRSSNTYFVALEDQLGSVEGPVRAAQRMGLSSLDPVADRVVAERRGSFTLGPEATSPLALASAYSTLGAGGTRCTPTPVTEVLDRNGRPLAGPDGTPVPTGPSCEPGAIRPEVATTLNQILVGDTALPIGTGTRAAVPGHQVAGKTGTSQDRFSVAFVGYTPRYAASVMVLNPKQNQDVGGFGGGRGAQVWHDAMLPVLTAGPPEPFPPAGLPLVPPPG